MSFHLLCLVSLLQWYFMVPWTLSLYRPVMKIPHTYVPGRNTSSRLSERGSYWKPPYSIASVKRGHHRQLLNCHLHQDHRAHLWHDPEIPLPLQQGHPRAVEHHIQHPIHSRSLLWCQHDLAAWSIIPPQSPVSDSTSRSIFFFPLLFLVPEKKAFFLPSPFSS